MEPTELNLFPAEAEQNLLTEAEMNLVSHMLTMSKLIVQAAAHGIPLRPVIMQSVINLR